MTDPYTSKICKHSFSNAILEMCRQNRGPTECPIPGCRRYFTAEDLYQDKKLARKVKRMIAQQNGDNEEIY